MKNKSLVIMKFLCVLVVISALFVNSSDAASKKVYLQELSFNKRPIVESVLKDIINKCDSITNYKNMAYMIDFLKVNDKLLVISTFINPKHIKQSENLRGFIIMNHRYLFIYCDNDIKNLFTTKRKRISFSSMEWSGVYTTNDFVLCYEITENSFQEISYQDWFKLYIESFSE